MNTFPTIYRGCTGPLVTRWQQFLAAHGYPVPAIGIFGPRTETFTRNFQTARGIEDDGVVGPSTYGQARALDTTLPDLSAPAPVPTVPAPSPFPPSVPVDDLTLRHNDWPLEEDASEFFGYPPALTHVVPPWWMKTWDNGWHHVPFIVCNPLVAASVTRCLHAMWEVAGRDPSAIIAAGFDIFDGCYNDRSVRGAQTLSMHARAAALDFNADKWPLRSEGRWPDEYARPWIIEGWRLGENYLGRKDPMHVEACR